MKAQANKTDYYFSIHKKMSEIYDLSVCPRTGSNTTDTNLFRNNTRKKCQYCRFKIGKHNNRNDRLYKVIALRYI